MAPGADEMVGPGLGSRIGGVWRIGRVFMEEPVRPERAENFVGRNMVEAEIVLNRALQALPIFVGGVKQDVSADDIGLNEGAGTLDRTVDMALGGKVHVDVG